MEGVRFTSVEGAARLATAVRARNTLAALSAEHAAFVAGKLLQEDAYRIRGLLSQDRLRSVYVARATRVPCVAYELDILTDLKVAWAVECGDVDWGAEMEIKEVLVTTSAVLRRLLEERVLEFHLVNVLVIESCHRIHCDPDLHAIMAMYSEYALPEPPRILALTYPLFSKQSKSETPTDESENSKCNTYIKPAMPILEYNMKDEDKIMNKQLITSDEISNLTIDKDEISKAKIIELDDEVSCSKIFNGGSNDKSDELKEKESSTAIEQIDYDNNKTEIAEQLIDRENYNIDDRISKCNENEIEQLIDEDNTLEENEQYDTTKKEVTTEIQKGPESRPTENKVEENFNLYEKLEWKIKELEQKLRCAADLAEDIDGTKRLAATVNEPRELIIQYGSHSGNMKLPLTYVELEAYMRETVADMLEFIHQHRYDPTEIYGEHAFCDELKGIPDPTLDPKEVFYQFLYILDELGPYGADKAALALVAKLEKLKVKTPYERHFLLLCMCTTVFLKIRCVSEQVFQNFQSDWEKIQRFSSSKIKRFIEILEQFKLPNCLEILKNSPNHKSVDKNSIEVNIEGTDKKNIMKCKENNKNSSSLKKTFDAPKLLEELDQCDFKTLGDKLQDQVNTYEANLPELYDIPVLPNDKTIDLELNKDNIELPSYEETEIPNKVHKKESQTSMEVSSGSIVDLKSLGVLKRAGTRNRGRGRQPRHGHTSRALQMQLNPDALCGIVFMNEPLMARVLFMIVVDLSRSHPSLGYLCAQYTGEERPADPVREPRELERQRRKQEEVLKKFRMHECNLLLATSSVEEGIDLPRCNLVLRWDPPASYRSHSVCRSRARAPRAVCALIAREDDGALLHRVAVYRELDQMLGRKCGCGIQDEPPLAEEEHANRYTAVIKPYSPTIENDNRQGTDHGKSLAKNHLHISDKDSHKNVVISNAVAGKIDANVIASKSTFDSRNEFTDDISKTKNSKSETEEGKSETTHGKSETKHSNSETKDVKSYTEDGKSERENNEYYNKESDKQTDYRISDSELAYVDLNSAISLINRYCGKLPSDTFTRLAPQWWLEEVSIPTCSQTNEQIIPEQGDFKTDFSGRGSEHRKAYICTLRLPLNCPVKYNIVGHPMPTRVLARRMVALQACRILHRSAELDNNLMPIGKENFKAADVEYAPAPPEDSTEPADPARPGTTKRRQYYYKRTAWSFTDCQPVQNATDAEIEAHPRLDDQADSHSVDEDTATDTDKGGRTNMLYAIISRLCCALPERYNTRGRKLHVPQTARQGLGILTSKEVNKIPAFPVYTRSGEVRVSLERVADADARVSPRRARLVRRFVRFVFADVLRVRRRGMRLSADGRHNGYYVVPTCRSVLEDGTEKIDIDWAFLELIYEHTEKQSSELDRPPFWTVGDHDCTCPEISSQIDTSGSQNPHSGSQIEAGRSQEPQSGNQTESNAVQNSQSGSHVETNSSREHQPGTQKESDVQKPESGSQIQSDDSQEDSENPVEGKEDGDKSEEEKKELKNPLLRAGEKYVFDADKYREAVVTPWYRNQDQPQFFLVAEICWKLSPESAFPSATHTTFRHYYARKYNVRLTQTQQPLLDVDHTSARLNLLTPRYVNRKGVALPVSSERTRRAKRDRLDQKQILVPELCRVHPFAAPLWFATVALPCVLYRINALLIADEIRRAVAVDVGLGTADVPPDFEWPPLDFGWSLAEVLRVDEAKAEREKRESPPEEASEPTEREEGREKTVNDILQEKEDAENGFEIGTWSNDMASSLPDDFDLLEPLPPNITLCTSASGGANWSDNMDRPRPPRTAPARAFSMADSDCSYMSSDLDTDDSSLESEGSDDDTSCFGSALHTNARLGVRIEYRSPHEAEALETGDAGGGGTAAPQPDRADDERDRALAERVRAEGEPPDEYILKFRESVEKHKKEILEKGLLVREDEPITSLLPPTGSLPQNNAKGSDTGGLSELEKNCKSALFKELFPYGSIDETELMKNGNISIETIEKSKRILLNRIKKSLTDDEIRDKNCFSMVDIDLDSPNYVNEKVVNVGFDDMESFMKKWNSQNTEQNAEVVKDRNENEFDFDYQPKLEGHPGPSPSVILQALTMSNANDGINLERLETIGDSFLKFAITAYLYCAQPTVHEGKLSHMRSKQVSNLNLYRLGRSKRLGARMIAAKFEPHDNWLPPCHRAPATVPGKDRHEVGQDTTYWREGAGGGCGERGGCFIPYNLITQHSIPDKSVADCVEALIGAYLIECGPRGALLFMSWLGIKVLPRYEIPLEDGPVLRVLEKKLHEVQKSTIPDPPVGGLSPSVSTSSLSSEETDGEDVHQPDAVEDWAPGDRRVGTLRPYRDAAGRWLQPVFGELRAPPSPLLRYITNADGELEQMLSGYEELERTLRYRFRDRSLLLQAMTHASHQLNRLTDCYQRLEFLGDAILDYLITRHLYEDARRHSPGALTDLRSALVNNTIFATLAVRHGFHKYFRHMSPGLDEVLARYVKIQEENGHSISEEHYLIQEDEMEQAEDVEVPKALGDLFESVAGAIFLDSGMSLGAVWRSYVGLMGAELEAFSAAAPKSPVRELLEAEPDTAKFGKPERLADGRRVRVCVEVFGRGTFKGVGRNYRIAKGTAARCALRHLKRNYRDKC